MKTRRFTLTHLFSLVLICFLVSCSNDPKGGGEPTPPSPPDINLPVLSTIDWEAAAEECSTVLTERFWNKDRHYFNYGADGLNTGFMYWHQAHALDVLVDAYVRSGNPKYMNLIQDWYEGVKQRNSEDDQERPEMNLNFRNVYIDDMEWIALAMLRAYNVTGEERFMETAKELWYEKIKVFWNEYAGGGIAWKQDMLNSKNACSNGPACILACRMYNLGKDESDKQIALDIFNWMLKTLYNSSTGAVYDCVIDNGADGLFFNRDATTYNQGTFIGSAIELYALTGDQTYLGYATQAANLTVENMVIQGTSVLGGADHNDIGIFAGIFMRYFTQLITTEGLSQAVRNRYMVFLDKNAEVAWKEGLDHSNYLFSYLWTSPPSYNYTKMHFQLNGCLLMESRALLERYIKDLTSK